MARPLRIEFAGAVYHVTSRGNERRPIFRTNNDRLAFLRFLGETVERFGWSVTAWVLMTNHFHLAIRTAEPNLSRGMHLLNGRYAGWFNRTHHRSGHLFRGRFHAFLIHAFLNNEDAYLAEVIRYVVLNPVRAGMVERPEKYRWSSYRATGGFEAAPEWLDVATVLALFERQSPSPEAGYRDFVMARVTSEERLWDKVINGIYLGTEAWAKQMRKRVESKPRSSDHPTPQRAVGRPKMAEIVAAVAKVSGQKASAIRAARGGRLGRLVSWIGWYEGLVTLRSIAASLRFRSEGYISALIQRCQRELPHDPALESWLDAALTALNT
jgi:putative transposase